MANHPPISSSPVTINGTVTHHSNSPDVNNITLLTNKEGAIADNKSSSLNDIHSSPTSNLIQSNMFHSFHLDSNGDSPPLTNSDNTFTNGNAAAINGNLSPIALHQLYENYLPYHWIAGVMQFITNCITPAIQWYGR